MATPRTLVLFSLPILAALSFGPDAIATGPHDLPSYEAGQPVSGLIRSWGDDEMAGVLKLWQADFSRSHPEIRYFDTLKGSDTAQAALYSSVTDLALMGREIRPLEVYPLFRRKHYFPTEIAIGTGSANDRARTFALAIFVNRENPISRLTLGQLEGMFAAQRNGFIDKALVWHDSANYGPANNLRTWGQAGLTGDWADRPIHPYGYPTTVWAESATAPGASNFFKEKVFGGGDKWSPDLVEYDQGEQIAAAVAKDPNGIGYTSLAFANPSVKAVALAAAEGSDYIELSKASVASRQYPLARPVYIYIDRDPAGPVDPKVREFLRYVLSREGQAALDRDGAFSALPVEEAKAQLKKLD